MSKITDGEGFSLNCTEINTYESPTITYYVVAANEMGYLFGTLDEKESFADYADRMYWLIEDGWQKAIMLIERADSVEDLKIKAYKYSGYLRDASLDNKPDEKGLLARLLKRHQ